MRRQFVNKIACVNCSAAVIRFTAREKDFANREKKGDSPIESQPSGDILISQYAVIDLTNVQNAIRNQTEFEIFVEQEPLKIETYTSSATVTFSTPNRDTATFIATYLVTGLAGSLAVTLLE